MTVMWYLSLSPLDRRPLKMVRAGTWHINPIPDMSLLKYPRSLHCDVHVDHSSELNFECMIPLSREISGRTNNRSQYSGIPCENDWHKQRRVRRAPNVIDVFVGANRRICFCTLELCVRNQQYVLRNLFETET